MKCLNLKFKSAIFAVTVIGLLPPLTAGAQFIQRIYGMKVANSTSFSAVNVVSTAFSTVSLMGNVSGWSSGITTYDDANYRYFTHTTNGILVINALSGVTIDTIKTTPVIYNIEYDKRCNCLVGIYWNGSSEKIASVNVATKAFTTHGTLNGVSTITGGESTFDPVKRRYFTITDIGILVIDSNRILTDVIPSSVYFGGLEYDPVTSKLYGWISTPSKQFVSVNISSHAFTSLGPMEGVTGFHQGTSTMNKTLGHYFISTLEGIRKFDTQSGNLIQSYPPNFNFGLIEFSYVPDQEAGLATFTEPGELRVFPNPGLGNYTFSGLPGACTINIYDKEGSLIQSCSAQTTKQKIKLDNVSRGLYFYHILQDGKETGRGKLLME